MLQVKCLLIFLRLYRLVSDTLLRVGLIQVDFDRSCCCTTLLRCDLIKYKLAQVRLDLLCLAADCDVEPHDLAIDRSVVRYAGDFPLQRHYLSWLTVTVVVPYTRCCPRGITSCSSYFAVFSDDDCTVSWKNMDWSDTMRQILWSSVDLLTSTWAPHCICCKLWLENNRSAITLENDDQNGASAFSGHETDLVALGNNKFGYSAFSIFEKFQPHKICCCELWQ